MKRRSRNSSASNVGRWPSGQVAKWQALRTPAAGGWPPGHPATRPLFVGTRALCALLGALLLCGGCSEAFQKKFRRKKGLGERFTPVIQFEDYSQGATPLDRYRKHYTLFGYWNAELLDTMVSTGNEKRMAKASGESLDELRELIKLLQPSTAGPASSLLSERERIDRQLKSGSYLPSQLAMLRQRLEWQEREIHRALYWRKVQDQLQVPPTGATSTPAVETGEKPATTVSPSGS